MFTTIFTIDLNSFWVYGVRGGGAGGAEPVATDSRRITTDQDRSTCLFATEYLLNGVRIIRQL